MTVINNDVITITVHTHSVIYNMRRQDLNNTLVNDMHIDPFPLLKVSPNSDTDFDFENAAY